MKLNTPNALAVACGLGLVVSMLSGNVFARGSGGLLGRAPLRRMSHSSSHMTTRSHNVGRGTPTNGMNRVKNFRTNRTSALSGATEQSVHGQPTSALPILDSEILRLQQPVLEKIRLGPVVRPWGCGFGWGWGSWYSPNCYGWCSYETLPVVAYYNPYCECGNVVDGVDYSVPIASASATANDSDDSDAFATAREAFHKATWTPP